MNHVSFLQMDVVETLASLFTKEHKVSNELLASDNHRKDYDDTERLFRLAHDGDISILSHPKISEMRGVYKNTPLHRLAIRGCVEVLEHPDAYTVKNALGKTPADYLQEVKKGS